MRNGEVVNLQSFSDFLKTQGGLFTIPRHAHAFRYSYVFNYNKIVAWYDEIKHGWILMSKDILSGSQGVKSILQQEKIQSLKEPNLANYRFPALGKASIGIYNEYFRFKKWLLLNSAIHQTRCEELTGINRDNVLCGFGHSRD